MSGFECVIVTALLLQWVICQAFFVVVVVVFKVQLCKMHILNHEV